MRFMNQSKRFCLRKKRKMRELIGMNQKCLHLRISLRMWKSGKLLKQILSSSVASALLKVATERASLLARAAALERKHALDMEKAQLKTKMEQMELEMNLAESEAKLKGLDNFESQNEQQLPTHAPQAQHGDGMNGYLETYHENTDATANSETSPVEFVKLGAIPKTPLQRYLNQ